MYENVITLTMHLPPIRCNLKPQYMFRLKLAVWLLWYVVVGLEYYKMLRIN